MCEHRQPFLSSIAHATHEKNFTIYLLGTHFFAIIATEKRLTSFRLKYLSHNSNGDSTAQLQLSLAVDACV